MKAILLPIGPVIRLAAAMVGLAFLSGCGSSTLPPPSDPALARPILTTALDAWQRGEPPSALAASDNPVRVIDSQWDGGWALLSYTLKDEGRLSGVSVRQAVDLKLKNPKGKVVKKTSNFLVNTVPEAVVTREDLDGE